ncbi:MAG TPA: hypothetical protein VGM86_29000 [Thermoanaerobaculia bacterium]|jgi:hypothetical protein
MAKVRRVNLRSILADPELRRELMVPTLQATQAREGIETSREQAERAYYRVTEGERATFFDLERFGGSRGLSGRREEIFVRTLASESAEVRFDVARRDFGFIEGSPLAYRRIGIVADVFRRFAALEPTLGRARVGGYTGNDEKYIRMWWEPLANLGTRPISWKPYAKGGGFSRFYSDVYLVVPWDSERQTYAGFFGRAGRSSHLPDSVEDYFLPGLTWPRRTQRGFNLRYLPANCVFSNKGPVIIAEQENTLWYLLGAGNSGLAEFLLRAVTSFGSWEVGVVRRLPVPEVAQKRKIEIGGLAKEIHDLKAAWDEGNEISTRFRRPWLLRSDISATALSTRLQALAALESSQEARIQQVYAELNDTIYKIYGISDPTRDTIEGTLGDRPPEVLWPQMEGQSVEQKRMEHVFRLLSYAVKRVVEADEDGVVPFVSMAGEPSLLERVLDQLHSFFPDRDIGQVEIEIVNEINQSVKGYRRTRSLAEWLENVFFGYHTDLYKSRPIFWHIASGQGTSPFAFGALVHYHKFNRDRMAKLRSQYLREAIETFRREAALADKEGRADDRAEWQARLEEAQDLDGRLQWIQEGHHEGPEGGERDFRILTPWKTSEERPLGWDPDLDDGVKVNIEPLQKAGVLRIAKVI